ncbi:MAG: HAD-IIIA family hydrolase, partial [Clostridia bacterium]|nr:HAD-IIIA family hydrolase [Clostridia bacterium]
MLFIFDFDYTLVDTSKGIIKSFNYAMQKTQGKTFSDGIISNTIGWNLKDAFSELSGAKTQEEYDDFYKYFMESSYECMSTEAKIYPDTLYVLKKLKDEGHKIAILSAKDTLTINKIAEKFQFKEYIDRVVGEDTVKNCKPNSEGVESIIKYFPTYTSDNICMVGDSIIDYQTAKNMGLNFIAVTTGKTT